MKINRTLGLAVGAGVLSVGIFGAAGYAYLSANLGAAPGAAVVAEPVAAAEPSAAPTAVPDQAKPEPLKQIAKGLTDSAATYLGMKPMDLMAQLKAGKSVADVANATPGKSRDGLVAALTSAASAKLDAAVADGTLTADQATMAKPKLGTEIARLVDRTGHK